VNDVSAVNEHEIVGEQSTVATPPHRLAAHNGQRLSSGETQQILNPARKGSVSM
jgi:hypothetical protein